jgi:hypothetical protein
MSKAVTRRFQQFRSTQTAAAIDSNEKSRVLFNKLVAQPRRKFKPGRVILAIVQQVVRLNPILFSPVL